MTQQDRLDQLHNFLQNNAVYDPAISDISLSKSDLSWIFNEYSFKQLSMGMNTRVFRILDTPWVVKEGRWDIDLNLIGDFRLMLPAKPLESFLNLFEMNFLPNSKEILRQYNLYLKFVRYFGYFSGTRDYYHPELEDIIAEQREIREGLSESIEFVEKKLKIKLDTKLQSILLGTEKYSNFIPEEYLLYGESISEPNGSQDTYFIFQRFVEGKLMHDADSNSLTQHLLKQLIVLSYLILLMRAEEGFVPDTRPRYPFEAYDWLTKTDNIIVNSDEAKFIDTRWMWDTNANIVKRGLILPDITVNYAHKYINNYVKHID